MASNRRPASVTRTPREKRQQRRPFSVSSLSLFDLSLSLDILSISRSALPPIIVRCTPSLGDSDSMAVLHTNNRHVSSSSCFHQSSKIGLVQVSCRGCGDCGCSGSRELSSERSGYLIFRLFGQWVFDSWWLFDNLLWVYCLVSMENFTVVKPEYTQDEKIKTILYSKSKEITEGAASSATKLSILTGQNSYMH